MEQKYYDAKAGIATCNLLDIKAENSNNLQMLHYSQLPIESGVDNRWKSALCQKKEGWCRTDARGAWHCRQFGSSSHYCSKSISCNPRDAANQIPTLVKTASLHYFLSSLHTRILMGNPWVWPVATIILYRPKCLCRKSRNGQSYSTMESEFHSPFLRCFDGAQSQHDGCTCTYKWDNHCDYNQPPFKIHIFVPTWASNCSPL